MTQAELQDDLLLTLTRRFLNHLELITEDSDAATQGGYEDAVLKNLSSVGKLLFERNMLWTTVVADQKGSAQANLLPAITILMDKVGKIGRRSQCIALLTTSLKFYAVIVVSCEGILTGTTADGSVLAESDASTVSVIRLVNHVQTLALPRDKAHSPAWRTCLEMANALLIRLKDILGEVRFNDLTIKTVRKSVESRSVRKQERALLPLVDPMAAAKMKNRNNQRKDRAKKLKKSVRNKLF